MFNFLISHLNSLGLILDISGVSILFFVVVDIGEQIELIDTEEEKNRTLKKRKKEIILKIGYGLICIGFILQLISSEVKSR